MEPIAIFMLIVIAAILIKGTIKVLKNNFLLAIVIMFLFFPAFILWILWEGFTE